MKTQIDPGRKGTLILIPVFLMIFFLGLSLLGLTHLHLRLGGVRRHLALANLSAENGLKMGFLFLWEKAKESPWPLVINNSDWQLLTTEPDEKLYLWLLSRLLKVDFPFFLQSSWENMSWKTNFSLGLTKIDLSARTARAKFSIFLKAEGKMLSSAYSSYSQLNLETELLAGYLPLVIFPLLIEKRLDPEEQSNYLQTKRIELFFDKMTMPAVKPFFSQGEMISREIAPFLEKGLKLKLLKPGKINPIVLRQVLGLEESKDPVPQGVYLVKDDLGLGGVFVQGNLDKFILTIEDGYQVITFQQADKRWELRFNPSSGQTIWLSPEKNFIYDSLPNGIILINGNILSLEGGDDDKMIGESDDLPAALLPGIKLCLVTSGNININSPLFQPRLETLPGIPYIQKKQTQLIIFSAGKDLITGEEKEAVIIINPGKRNEMIIEANLTAPANGVRVEGGGEKIIIKGGLQAADIENQASILKIVPSPAIFNSLKAEDLFPLTENPVVALVSFKPLEWKDNERLYTH